MRRRHLRAVLRIENTSVHRPWSLGLFLNELGLKDTRFYVVAKAGSSPVSQPVVGYAGLLVLEADAHLTTISVDERWRRRGVGERLMWVLIHLARSRECEAVTLEVRESNHPAISMYRKFGFEVRGRRKNYYSDLGEDALVMWVTDIRATTYLERLERIEAGFASPTLTEGLEW
ncbi:MAG: ribosomal protein S18-alanine N-acetyltransferase [Acidimicrobiales bacterium]|nr:ribosomal protein S18-alanine N-acetyltransferase [Acidimicrobiales bacterium]